MESITITLSDEIFKKLSALANKHNSDISSIITALIGDKLQSDKPKSTPMNQPSKRGALEIVVYWDQIGKGNKEIIRGQNDAGTLALLVERLVNALGDEIFYDLEKYRIGRGPFVSRSPSIDYLNKTTGTLYGHKEIGNTDYYVLTHSSKKEKIHYINNLNGILGFKKKVIIANSIV